VTSSRTHRLAIGLVLLTSLVSAQPESQNPFKDDPQAVEAGRSVFRVYCSGCHGIHAQGGRGPDLTRGIYSAGNRDADLFKVISNGVPRTEMSSFSAGLGDENIWRVITYIRSTMRHDAEKAKGDPASGEKVFWGKGCGSCHRVGQRGGQIGPDLTLAGKNRSVEYLRDSVITPNADLTPGYATISVITKDGRKIVGVQRSFDSLSAQLVDLQGNSYSFRKSEVSSLSRDFISLMPGDYAKLLTASQLDDLIAYLSQLGTK